MKLMDFELYSYQLTAKLRSILAKPKGVLIEGSIDETLPVLKSKLLPKQGLIICVGDVITNLLVEHNFNPDLVITDGKTKRELIEKPFQNSNYISMKTKSPAGMITKNAWSTIKKSLSQLSDGQYIHIDIDGEEIDRQVIIPRKAVQELMRINREFNARKKQEGFEDAW